MTNDELSGQERAEVESVRETVRVYDNPTREQTKRLIEILDRVAPAPRADTVGELIARWRDGPDHLDEAARLHCAAELEEWNERTRCP